MRVEGATTVKTATTSTSLVGWWTFDDASSTIATDFSGYRNHGTLTGTGGPTWITGKHGKALRFAGQDTNNNHTVAIAAGATNPELAILGDVTVSAWIKPSSSYFDTNEAVLRGGQGADLDYSMFYDPVNKRPYFHWYDGGFPSVTGTSNSVPFDQWSHVVIVRSGLSVSFYVNGVFTNAAAVTAPTVAATQISIGRTNNVGVPQDFSGDIDDVRIYNQALSTSTIIALYKSGQVNTTPANKSGLVSYWPMNEGTSTSAGDFSGYRNNFTLTNFANVASSTSGWNIGKKGKALTFDGIDDYANISQPNIQTSPNVFTISGWIYPENQYARFLTPTSNGIDQWVGYDNTNQRLELTITEIADVNNRSRYSTTGSVPLNRWTHWAVSINDKEIRIYINGVLDSSYTEVIDIAAWNLTWTLGQRGNSTSWFKGKLDELRVYSRILTATEVKAVYKANETSVNTAQNTKITDGLIGYWSFNGPDIDNSNIYDRSMSADHAYLVGSVSTSSVKTLGKVGQAMNFTGANYYVNATSTVGNITTNQVTVAGWVYPYTTSSIMTLISNDRDCGGCGSYKGYGLQMYYGGTTVFRIWNDDGSGPRAASSANNPAANEWTHLAGTFDGTTIRLYKNGVQISSSASVGNGTLGYPASFDTKIGQLGCCSGTHTMNGKIDEVRVYDRALSATEIKRLYLLGK